jgi:aryl-alcohol dehydrogenase-like predicted oxidoreductase
MQFLHFEPNVVITESDLGALRARPSTVNSFVQSLNATVLGGEELDGLPFHSVCFCELFFMFCVSICSGGSLNMNLAFEPTPITLGAVQLGLSYGVANATGMPSEEEASAILDAAMAGGIEVIDTARAYGASEERIGRWLARRSTEKMRIVTKIPAVPEADGEARYQFVSEALAASSRALGKRKLDLVLAHRGRDLLDNAVRAALEQAQADDLIAGFGASVYEPEEAAFLIRTVPIQALQAPISLADRRMAKSGLLEQADAAGIAVFARSAFLQGALLMAPERLPAHLNPLSETIVSLGRLASDLGISLHAMALAGVRDLHGVASVVVGVERAEQLPPHLAAMKLPALPTDVMEKIDRLVERLPAEIIDPSRWPRVERPGARG